MNELRKGARLDLFDELEADRPLLNNPDLDPDENYFTVRPNHCTYNTISSLTPVRSQISSLLSIMHINCRSILSKLSDIERILRFLSIDILAVSETWLDYTTARSIHTPGYNFEFQCRTASTGGGVGFFIKHSLIYYPCDLHPPCSNQSIYESSFLRFPLANGSYFITGVIYRPPGHNLEDFNNEWNNLLSALLSKNKDLYIIGDFNVDLLKAHKHNYTNNFLDITLAHQVLPVITQPTCFSSTSATLIDNMFTNRMHKIMGVRRGEQGGAIAPPWILSIFYQIEIFLLNFERYATYVGLISDTVIYSRHKQQLASI